jgi:poly-gamma-glutamate capsule biosynthesis protein CapA/YwtB (metallophosphatase superfamily)
MSRVVAFAGLIVVFFGVLVAVLVTRPGASAETAATTPAALPVKVKLSSTLPAWVAPGVRVPISGFASSDAVVRARLDGRSVAVVHSGRLGGFRIVVIAPRSGRYAVSVKSNGVTARAGTLLVRPVILDAVGDVTTGEQVGASVSTLGSDYPWSQVGPTLRAADVATANLEGAVSSRGVAVADKEFHFRGSPALLRSAHVAGGLDVVTVANNHSGDYGSVALLDTIRFAHAAGIQTVGGGVNAAAALRPVIVTVGGLRIGFVGLSDVNPYGFNATADSPGTAKADPDTVAAAVRAARRQADVVVCWFHWGTELVLGPSERQRELAAAALNAGAQVVLGAHPHIFGAVTSPTHATVVAWTLGNFVFPASSAGTTRTGILTIALDRNGVRGWRVQHATIHGFRPELDR